jgi:riboflavin synthase
MFTGIIKDLGQVKQIVRPGGRTARLSIQSPLATELAPGASVSINGACHTVLSSENNRFLVESSPETLAKTNLGSLRVGDKVNLEPALTLGQGLDGHLVQGHVDGTGRLKARRALENASLLTISARREILKYLVPKGSVAVEGVSLTVVGCYADSFTTCLVPYSAEYTTLGKKKIGALVNLEVDIISKYVAQLLSPRT